VIVATPAGPEVAVTVRLGLTTFKVVMLSTSPTVVPSSFTVIPPNEPDAALALPQ